MDVEASRACFTGGVFSDSETTRILLKARKVSELFFLQLSFLMSIFESNLSSPSFLEGFQPLLF